MSNYLERTNGATSFVGSDVDIPAVAALALSLKLYVETGITLAATPTRMLKIATSYTGKTYKRGHYIEAVHDLFAYAEELKSRPRGE